MFLNNKNRFNKSYSRVLKHRILKKLKQIEELVPILLENDITKPWATEYLNVKKNCNGGNVLNKTNSSNEVVARTRFELVFAAPEAAVLGRCTTGLLFYGKTVLPKRFSSFNRCGIGLHEI